MAKKFKKDTRDKLWAKLESEIQSRADKKDKNFVLSGKWKKFVRRQENFKIYVVDGKWVRNNLSVIFAHGGHGYVFEFIPKNEIWVSTHHPNETRWSRCKCKLLKKGQRLSKNFFDSTVIHEITEFKEMKKGKIYYQAHQIALQKEKEMGLLKNPFTEINVC